MQPTGISPNLLRFLTSAAPDLMTELFTPGKVLEADVVSVFKDRAVLAFGRGVRLEVALQTPLQEGQRVRVQVQPREGAPSPGQAPQAQATAPAPRQVPPGAGAPGLAPQAQAAPAPGQAPLPQGVPLAQVPQMQAAPAGAPTQPVPQGQPAPQGQPLSQGQPASQGQPTSQGQPGLQGQPAPQAQQSGVPAQAQPTHPAARQAAPPAPAAQTAEPAARQAPPAAAPIVLKVLGPAPQREAGRAAPTQPGPAPAQAPASAPAEAQGSAVRTTQATAIRDTAATALPGQTAPVANQPQAQQPPALPQVLWLPIPLPDGGQGWAQLHVQEDDSPKTRAQRGGPVQQVRIWWETPALGPVQVTLEATAANLAALFTPAAAESKGVIDQALYQLQRRFAEVGFPEARVGCRPPAPGESVEPARIEGANRLDKRL